MKLKTIIGLFALAYCALAQAPAPPAIISAGTLACTMGTACSYQIVATNQPTSYAATGLPIGLSLNPVSGLISGTPTLSSTGLSQLTATNAAGTGTLVLTIIVAIPNLPPYLVGSGMSWLRGSNTPLNNESTFAINIGSSNWYSWTSLVTPIAKTPVGTPPLASTITTGATYVVVCSKAKSVCFALTALGGISAASAGVGVQPAFSGAGSIALKPWKPSIYVVISAKVSNAAYSPTSGALATAILSPCVQVFYGFHK